MTAWLRELAGGAVALALVVALVRAAAPASPRPPVELIVARDLWWPSLTPALARGELPSLARLARAQHGRLAGDPTLFLRQHFLPLTEVEGLPALEAAVARSKAAALVVVGWRSGLPDGQGVWLASGAGARPGPLDGPVRAEEVVPSALALAGLPLPRGVSDRPSAAVVAGPCRWEPR